MIVNYQKHKWHDAIVAYAEGRPIQFRLYSDPKWIDFNLVNCPAFGRSGLYEWRVKPEPVVIHYRNALMKNSQGKFRVGVIPVPNEVRWEGFVKWIGEVQSYTVEE